MSIIKILYPACHTETKTVAPNINGFQGINNFIQYLDMYSHKPIFHSSNYYDGYNITRLTWSGNQVEDYTTHNCL